MICLTYMLYLSMGIATIKFLVSMNQPRTILDSSSLPSASHFFADKMYSWRMFGGISLGQKGQANRLMARRMAAEVLAALSRMCRHTPTRSSIYEST